MSNDGVNGDEKNNAVEVLVVSSGVAQGEALCKSSQILSQIVIDPKSVTRQGKCARCAYDYLGLDCPKHKGTLRGYKNALKQVREALRYKGKGER